MKFITTFIVILLGISTSLAQTVGVGTSTPNPKSALEIVQGTQPQGFLIPRMKATDRISIAASASDIGLMVYDIDSLDIMQWNGSLWTRLGAADDDWKIVNNELLTSRLVGINVANPSQALEVGGDVIFGGGLFDGAQEFIMMNAESRDWYICAQNNVNPALSDFFISKTQGPDGTFHIEPSGDIGIGTTTPDVNLDVNGALAIKDSLVGSTSAELVIGDKSYYKIESVPGDFVNLTKGLTIGQIIIIQCTGVGIGIVDDALMDAEGTGVLLEHNDTATFIWDGVQWIQTAYSDNSP